MTSEEMRAMRDVLIAERCTIDRDHLLAITLDTLADLADVVKALRERVEAIENFIDFKVRGGS